MIDVVDAKILNILQTNARISNAEMARQIGMAPSAVLERVRKLERRGFILGYETRTNPKKLGCSLTAFIFVRSEENVGSTETGKKLALIPDVQEVHHIAGEDCYLVKVRVSDTAGLGSLLRKFGLIPEVRDTRTTVVLSTVKETLALPLPQNETDESGPTGDDAVPDNGQA